MAKRKFWIDLFAGAGGTSTGVFLAGEKVIACVNHDANALRSHKLNHRNCFHFTEDVRDFKVVLRLKVIVERLRRLYPDCIINIWASLECTNYSKAKGGLPRDADSRTLAYSLYMYLEHLKPDYVFIENVREFRAWGPLDQNGRPISRRNGTDYVKWCNYIQEMGYHYDDKDLNAADFAAYTSRVRYFGQFAIRGLPIAWPQTTHAKKPAAPDGLFEDTKQPWKAVREVLDLEDEGISIFERKKGLSENTLKRILAGLDKFVANGEMQFTKVYNSGNDEQRVKSLNEPIGSLTTQNSHAKVATEFLYHNHGGSPESKVWTIDSATRTITTTPNHNKVKAVFLNTYYGKGGKHSINEPSPTITTKDRVVKVDAKFFTNYYSGGGQLSDLNHPSPTITNVPKQHLTSCKFMDQQYGKSKPTDIDGPSGTLTANPKLNLVSTKHWLVDTQYGNQGRSIDRPGPTVIARQDKKPLYLIRTEAQSNIAIVVFEGDSEMTIKIKEFMAAYGIADIKMRMLKIPELLQIQGFPKDYKLKGTKTEQKKFIGNAVEVNQAKAIIEANSKAIEFQFRKAV